MLVQLFFFLVLTPAYFVITLRNPIYSVLALIAVFFNLALMLLCLEVEFLALVFLVVYVGAIAVLFLFVVMMLNVSKEHYSAREYYYSAVSGLSSAAAVYFWTLYLASFDFDHYFFDAGFFSSQSRYSFYSDYSTLLGSQTNSQYLAQLLYSYNFVPFVIASLVLLTAMVGSIALTIYHRADTKRQLIFQQVEKEYLTSIRLSEISVESPLYSFGQQYIDKG